MKSFLSCFYLRSGLFLAFVGFLSTEVVAKYNYPQTLLWHSLGNPNIYSVINPFIANEDNPTPRYWRTGGVLDIRPSYYHAYYREFLSKNNNRIINAVDKSYGKIFRAYGSWQIGVHYPFPNSRLTWEQYYHYTYGGIVRLINRSDTSLRALFLNAKGFTTSLAYAFSPEAQDLRPWSPLHQLKGSLRFGRVRYLYEDNYNAVDFFERRLRFNLKKYPWHFYFNLDLQYRYPISFLASSEIILQAKNISLGHNLHALQTFAGFKSFNFLRSTTAKAWVPYSFKLFAGIAPSIEGDFERAQTFIAGTEIFFLPQLRTDFFIQDRGYPGGAIFWQGKYGNLEIYTYQQAYDKFHLYKYRNYGLNLNLDWPWQS